VISLRLLAFALAIGPLAVLPASADLYSVGFPTGTFNVIDGKPYLLRSGERGPPGNALDVEGRSLVHYQSGKPLAYPLRGLGTPVVTLGKSDGTSTAWDLSAIEGERTGPIRAAEGKYKGWYLDWSESQEQIDYKGETLHVRKLILVKNPKAPRQLSTYEVGK